MAVPNVKYRDPSPEYINKLFADLRKLGRTKTDVCLQIGIPYRTMCDYTNRDHPTKISYVAQFAIEEVLEHEKWISNRIKKGVAVGDTRMVG